MSRLADLRQFYALLDELAHRTGGPMLLGECLQTHVPDRGVYFFFEPGEERRDSGSGPRVVRVGTHGLTSGSRSTLKQRLGQHRGTHLGTGNHRGSIFRLLVGQALLERERDLRCETWGVSQNSGKVSAEMRSIERQVEEQVSAYLTRMHILLLPVLDASGPDSIRAKIEAGAIALLSNHDRPPLDPPSREWLGRQSNRPLVRSSGLWNQRHVNALHRTDFLGELRHLILAA